MKDSALAVMLDMALDAGAIAVWFEPFPTGPGGVLCLVTRGGLECRLFGHGRRP